MTPTDEPVVDAPAAMTVEQLGAFVDASYRRLVGAVALAAGELAGAEDAVQESLASAWRRGEPIDTLAPRVVVDASNAVATERWSRDVSQESLAGIGEPLSQVSDHVMVGETFGAALAQLPLFEREAVILHYLLGQSASQTAEVLRTDPDVVTRFLSGDRQHLAEQLGYDTLPDDEVDELLTREAIAAANRVGAEVDLAAAAADIRSQLTRGRDRRRLIGVVAALLLIAGGIMAWALSKDDPLQIEKTLAADSERFNAVDCPGGATVAQIGPGDEITAVGRDEAGLWLAIRNPSGEGNAWLPSRAMNYEQVFELSVITCDDSDGSPGVAAGTGTTLAGTSGSTVDGTNPGAVVPGSSPSGTSIAPSAPDPSSTTPGGADPTGSNPSDASQPNNPATTFPPPPGPDRTPPVAETPTASELKIGEQGTPGCAEASVITIGATDNVGVARVTGTYEQGLPGSPLAFIDRGGTWTTIFGPFTDLPASFREEVLVVITIEDAVSNAFLTSVTVEVVGSGGC